MAIEFKYNKSSLHEMRNQLKVRENALPTLKSKEAALRIEVKRAKTAALQFEKELKEKLHEIRMMDRLWVEFKPDLVTIKKGNYTVRTIAGVKIPVLENIEFNIEDISLYHNPDWFLDGLQILKDLTYLSLQKEVNIKAMEILEYARKKSTQKVNLYEKVQIPDYKSAISRIKRFLEDEENLSKSAQKILKRRNEEKLAS
jgi:V/A-type H+-transporting ATPase subunit D